MAPRAATAFPSYATKTTGYSGWHDLSLIGSRTNFPSLLLPRDTTSNNNNNTNASALPPQSQSQSQSLDTHQSHLHTIYAKPFNHLSIWAYLAFALIILGIFTVVAYLVYTCYHSSRRSGSGSGHRVREGRNDGTRIDIMGLDEDVSARSMNMDCDGRRGLGLGRDDRFSHCWEYHSASASVSRESGGMGMGRGVGGKIGLGTMGDLGEKYGTGNSSRGVIGGGGSGRTNDSVEMKGFSMKGRPGLNNNKRGSESEENIFSLPSNSMSESIYNFHHHTHGDVLDTSFETNNTCTSNYLSSPPLAHISDKAAAYIPFHLPPPPPSPTPAYKEHLERQYYRGRRPAGVGVGAANAAGVGGGAGRGAGTAGQHSPVSPSPSCSVFSPATATGFFPPISTTQRTRAGARARSLTLILGDPDDDNTWASTSTSTDNEGNDSGDSNRNSNKAFFSENSRVVGPIQNTTTMGQRSLIQGQALPPTPAPVPGVQVHFDSNSISYVPPLNLNPFMTPSTVLLFNEPKLSPVLGTLTSSAMASASQPHHAANPASSASYSSYCYPLAGPSSGGDSSYPSRAVLGVSSTNTNYHPIPPDGSSSNNRDGAGPQTQKQTKGSSVQAATSTSRGRIPVRREGEDKENDSGPMPF